MPPEREEMGSAADWLRHAYSDLVLANQPLVEGVLVQTLCFHAQQAVEKSLKAVMVAKGVRFPYTHSISRLITVLREAGVAWPERFDEAASFTDYAVQQRYPGSGIIPMEEDRQEAIRIANEIYDWAQSLISAL